MTYFIYLTDFSLDEIAIFLGIVFADYFQIENVCILILSTIFISHCGPAKVCIAFDNTLFQSVEVFKKVNAH